MNSIFYIISLIKVFLTKYGVLPIKSNKTNDINQDEYDNWFPVDN
jgi:hypothetical protein